MDTMSTATRSRVMSRIRGRDTKPEMVVRRYLHARGLRYSLHVRALPGRPDMVFRTRRTVVFVHGCFWHGHDACATWRMPQSRVEYWVAKITGNKRRDAVAMRQLRRQGWQVHTVWACQLEEKRLNQLYRSIAKRPLRP